jgi:hypothetical protein
MLQLAIWGSYPQGISLALMSEIREQLSRSLDLTEQHISRPMADTAGFAKLVEK